MCMHVPTGAAPRCQAFEVCAPLNDAQLLAGAQQLPAGAMAGDVGICTQPLPGGLLLPNTSAVPPPLCAPCASALSVPTRAACMP